MTPSHMRRGFGVRRYVMTLEMQRTLKCDGCGTTRVSTTDQAGTMRAKARKDGWHRSDNNVTDVCGDCWKARGRPTRNNNTNVLRKGELHPLSKLTEESVKDIRELAAEGMNLQLLAIWYKVSHSTIRNVVKKRTWVHVEDSPSANTSNTDTTSS